MSNIKLQSGGVLFPLRERAFVVTADGRAPFKTAVIGVTYPDPNYHIERDAIEDLTVFEYIEEGEGEIFINGEWRHACAGDTYILAPGEKHKYRACPTNPFKKYWINYISDYMTQYLSAYGIGTGIYHIGSVVHFEKLQELTKNSEISADGVYSIVENIHSIIALIAKENSEESTADKIKAILLSSVYGKLSLEEVSEKLHISKSSIIRTFKKSYGVSPYEFLLNAKIEIAKTLLRTTSLTVGQISDKLQIFDEHYFSTLFYKKVGVRPLKYRHFG